MYNIIIPVSYTHLDVYKRQSVSSSVVIKGSKICYMKLDIYYKSEKYIDGI